MFAGVSLLSILKLRHFTDSLERSQLLLKAGCHEDVEDLLSSLASNNAFTYHTKLVSLFDSPDRFGFLLDANDMRVTVLCKRDSSLVDFP